MRSRWAWVGALGLALACGQTSGDDTARSDASATGGTNASGGTTSAGGSAPTGGSGGISVYDGSAAGGTVNDSGVQDAGWFDCFDCACDGTTSYCYSFSAGALPPPPMVPPNPDAATCDVKTAPDGKGCVLLPAACQGSPSCDCLPTTLIWCDCYDDGGGLRVQCNAP